jgi:uncharacterized membrane protein
MAGERRTYIDWARGLAVLLMIEAHTLDAWTRAADRGSQAYAWLTVLGGFAAPFFLWLAGVGVALSAARTATGGGTRTAVVEAICRRGLEIFLFAFLFRLQAFVVSPGGQPVMLFRVDILNVMGLAIFAAGVLWPLADRVATRVVLYALVAIAIALATPIVRASPLVDALPVWMRWYVRPAGELTTFTLLPWAGFVFAGAASGVMLATVHGAEERRLHAAFAAAAIAVIGLSWLASMRPSIYSVPASFWTSSPAWFVMRVGIVMLMFSALAAVPARREGPFDFAQGGPLGRLGRASLFVYWIHVELVYGYASWLWRRSLPLWGTVLGCAIFALLMLGAVVARDRFFARRAVRISGAATAAQA